MPLPRTAARVLAGACALTLVLAACGGDDDSADTTDETTETTAAESTTTAADGSSTTEADGSSTTEADGPTGGRDEAEAQEIVDAINLTIDDFADGWTAEEQPEDGDDEGELDSCFTGVDVNETAVVEQETPQFSAETGDGTGQIVNMQTVVFDSVETAEAVVAETASNQFNGCAEDLFLTSFNTDGGSVEVDLEQSADEPPLTEESVGITGAITGTAPDGTALEGLVDLHVFRTADVVSFTLVLDLGDVAFEDTLQGLYTEIATRHAANVT
jgi:hypothetical protein